MRIETPRLTITELEPGMAEAVHRLSLDEDNRRFVPDEVFETVAEAAETIQFLRGCYASGEGPQVYAVLLKDGVYIGYVQAVPMADGAWEVGYHIGAPYTRQGYAAEAVAAFLPVITARLGIREIQGVCLADNLASVKVLERCGFTKLYEGVGLYQGQERSICRYGWKRTSLERQPKWKYVVLLVFALFLFACAVFQLATGQVGMAIGALGSGIYFVCLSLIVRRKCIQGNDA